jgi:dTMP kinase
MTNEQNTMKPKFIVIEGCDFTGKSSVIEKLVNTLVLRGIECVPTKALGGTEYGKKCRDYVMKNSGKVPNSVILDKMTESMHDMNEKIVSHAQKDGSFVVCDRYYHSTLIYQGICQNDLETVEERLLQANLIEPDLTFILDCSTEGILRRKSIRIETNFLDPKDKQEIDKIREGYLTLAQRKNTILVEVGSKTIDEVCEKILSYCV